MNVPAGYKQTEVGVIPEDWELWKLGQLSEFVTSGSRGWAKYYSDSGPLFIRSQNIRDGRFDFTDQQFVALPSATEGSRTKLNVSDLLITITGNNVGNVAWLENSIGEAYISQHVGLVRLLDTSLAKYICFFLTPGSPGNGQIFKGQVGQSKPGLNLISLENFWVVIPSTKTEQSAIATALSDTDALIESLAQLIAKKRQIKQGTMQELLTGQRRLPGFTGEWLNKTLEELADIRSGGTPSTSNRKFWDGDVLWCTPTDITALNGYKYLNETNKKITAHGLKFSSAEIISAGSIVMTSRATIGECAINTAPLSTNQGFKNFVPFNGVVGEFLYYLLTTHKQGFIGLCSGSTFLEIGKTQLRSYVVKFPATKAEQTAIATVLSDMDTELTALQNRLTKARHIKQGMMQELLTGRIRLL